MKIAYLILAHQHPALLARLIKILLAVDGIVAVHYDRNAGQPPLVELQQLLGASYDHVIWPKREAVIWGEWSLVQATLNGLEAIQKSGYTPDYVYLLSGSDYPIRPIEELKGFLERNHGKEFIESFSDKLHFWVKEGIQTERYLYRFPFNWSKNPRLFNLALKLQKMLKLKRCIPEVIEPHFGSQWWVLTWPTCRAILDITKRKEIIHFFKGVWVPDELFFQTVIRSIAKEDDIRSHALTLRMPLI